MTSPPFSASRLHIYFSANLDRWDANSNLPITNRNWSNTTGLELLAHHTASRFAADDPLFPSRIRRRRNDKKRARTRSKCVGKDRKVVSIRLESGRTSKRKACSRKTQRSRQREGELMNPCGFAQIEPLAPRLPLQPRNPCGRQEKYLCAQSNPMLSSKYTEPEGTKELKWK